MRTSVPAVDLATSFSSPGATPRAWPEVAAELERSELFWISTMRPDGRPHVTPLIAVWVDAALWFCTGPTERKARNLAENPACILTTGCNSLRGGLDVVVEGTAVHVRDDARLEMVADAFTAKYGEAWTFTVRDGAFHHEGGAAQVYELAPSVAFAFGKGEPSSQTRYRF